MMNEYLAKNTQECGTSALCRPQTLIENLASQLEQAKANVKRLEELVSLLTEHPEVNRILDLLKGGF